MRSAKRSTRRARRGNTRRRPNSSMVSNNGGATACPVSATRVALMSSPALTPFFSATPRTAFSISSCDQSETFSTWARAFFADEFDYDPAAVKKFLLKDDRLAGFLSEELQALEKVSDWTHGEIEKAVRGAAERAGVKAGLLINATRVALTGQAVAPPLFNTMELLGRRRVLPRLARLIKRFADLTATLR